MQKVNGDGEFAYFVSLTVCNSIFLSHPNKMFRFPSPGPVSCDGGSVSWEKKKKKKKRENEHLEGSGLKRPGC